MKTFGNNNGKSWLRFWAMFFAFALLVCITIVICVIIKGCAYTSVDVRSPISGTLTVNTDVKGESKAEAQIPVDVKASLLPDVTEEKLNDKSNKEVETP